MSWDILLLICRSVDRFAVNRSPEIWRVREGSCGADERYQLNTGDAFFYPERYLKIDNTQLTPDVVAKKIVRRFELPLRNGSDIQSPGEGQCD